MHVSTIYPYNRVMTQSYDSRSPAAGLLYYARRKSELSQSQLAKRAGVPTTMISAYECGKREPTLPTLMRLLKAAGYEIRMHIEPYDDHDDVLESLETLRSPEERERRDREKNVWRDAAVKNLGA